MASRQRSCDEDKRARKLAVTVGGTEAIASDEIQISTGMLKMRVSVMLKVGEVHKKQGGTLPRPFAPATSRLCSTDWIESNRRKEVRQTLIVMMNGDLVEHRRRLVMLPTNW